MQSSEMNLSSTKILDEGRCPLCEQPNNCQLCTVAAYKGACWCSKVKIPEELLARISPEYRNKACICWNCVMTFHRSRQNKSEGPKLLPDDFYFEAGLLVFTEAYHLRRGWCCGSNCRHCPYKGCGG